MLGLTKIVLVACSVASVFGAVVVRDDDASANVTAKNPVFTVPTLVQIRDILAQLEAPIISALTERLNLPSNPALYANNGSALLKYIKPREATANNLGRYAYGKLEYPFTFNAVKPDVTSKSNPFPPGRFHQDSYSGNPSLLSFYLNTLVPLFNASTGYFYHLDGSQVNDDATLNLDATILALLSHRTSFGKIVAESKYAADVSGFTPLIKAINTSQIRTLLTNTTQEAGVLAQAATAATAFSTAWVASGAAEPATFPTQLGNVAAKVFRELIDTTTDIEVQYLLQRFN
ncbi:chorismate mutase aro7 [Steccherinum ochraceum]|uniref:chorismate mutase n=1 Tax=Steccherinum ochraceum TaxID=92696 RepID=A0A4R0RAT1_9APHY|nr:chorismate mutase aro7 [Steccherinum ochraceum]